MQKKIIIRVLIALFAILGIIVTTKVVQHNKETEIKELCDRSIVRTIKLSAYDTIGYESDEEAKQVYEFEFSAADICTLGEAIDYVNSRDATKPFGFGNKTTMGRPLLKIAGVVADYDALVNRAYWNSSSTTHAACVGQKPIGGYPGSPNTCQFGLDNLILGNDEYNEFTWWRRSLS